MGSSQTVVSHLRRAKCASELGAVVNDSDLCLAVSNMKPCLLRERRVFVEVRQQYWQVAVARRRATEQRCFLQGRIGLEKKLHEYHLAKSAKSREDSGETYQVL